jgi:hypothetical protein
MKGFPCIQNLLQIFVLAQLQKDVVMVGVFTSLIQLSDILIFAHGVYLNLGFQFAFSFFIFYEHSFLDHLKCKLLPRLHLDNLVGKCVSADSEN